MSCSSSSCLADFLCSLLSLLGFLFLSYCTFRLLIETRGGTRKQSKDCCSVWAWRKSGIKMLVTARGLFFLFSSTFYEKCDFGHIFEPILGKSARIRQKVGRFPEKWSVSWKSDRFPEKVTGFRKIDAFYKNRRGFTKIVNFFKNSTTFRAENL